MACLYCDTSDLNILVRYGRLPLKMGTYEHPINGDSREFTIVECGACGVIQVANPPSPYELYNDNHNVDIVGKVWQQHYQSFYDFIKLDLPYAKVLEIGDPSAKIANLCRNSQVKEWHIVEPNPQVQSDDWLTIHKCLLNDFYTNERFDIVIHSHVLEHQTNPVEFMRKCRGLLKENGIMCFSIPDMEGLCSGKNVCSVLNFEHPYFMDRTLINKLNRIIGKRESVKVYANGSSGPHSLFYRVAKDNEESCFKRLIKEDQRYLYDLRNKIPYGCYIMSGHVKTQRLLADPIIASKVIGILDNADSKENQFLYGFPNMKIAKPSVDNVHCVITSHMGPYQAEINQQLLAINPLAVLL